MSVETTKLITVQEEKSGKLLRGNREHGNRETIH
jgi:hypothetical protein